MGVRARDHRDNDRYGKKIYIAEKYNYNNDK